ncbi:MAG TPA: PadR family transcriptional regulator, partial [Gemmatimonadaceae bacterium]|nr:PadR family transcriptional regulator [Gemmatimonadaceae bacterium]
VCASSVSLTRSGIMADLRSEYLQGTLDVLILKTLSWGPRHGYAIGKWLRETTDGLLRVEEGALYPALHRLERKKWIESEWGYSDNNRRAKYYQLTVRGRAQLRAQRAQWRAYAGAVALVLDA